MEPDPDIRALPASTSSAPTGERARFRFLTIPRLMALVVLAAILALLVFFVADNFVLVQIRVFALRIQARLAWVLIVPLLVGIAIGWVGHIVRERMRRV